eukprot:5327898-Amphidinium_carterae.1
MAMFGASPIRNADPLDTPPPQRAGAQSSGVTAPAHPVAAGHVDMVVPCNQQFQFGLAPIDGSAGVEQPLVPVAPHGQVPSVSLGHAVLLGHASQMVPVALSPARTNFGSIMLKSELSRMISETSVSNPYEEPRGLRRERQASMHSGRGQWITIE